MSESPPPSGGRLPRCSELGGARLAGVAAALVPADVLAAAHGVALLRVHKAGVMLSAAVGTGLVVARTGSDGRGPWSAPCAISAINFGYGFQVGRCAAECTE